MILVMLVVFDNVMSEISTVWEEGFGDAASYIVRGIVVLWLLTVLAFVPEWLEYIAIGLLCLPVILLAFFILGKKASREKERELEEEGRNIQAKMARRLLGVKGVDGS